MTKTNLKSLLVGAAVFALMTSAAFAAGTWNRGANGDVQSLDPHKTSTIEEGNITGDLFIGLVAVDSSGNTIPGAAESWTVSADGKVYTFKMRKDGIWSDGTPVTAKDFVFSIRRVLDPATASEYASMAFPLLIKY